MGELYSSDGEKKPWQSKTLWVNLFMAVASFFPVVRDMITPEHIGTVFTIVNIGLRFVTKDKLVLK